LHFAGVFYYYTWFEAVSFLPCLAGVFVLLGGWKALRWSWPAIAFLMFMVPLPYYLETAFGLYLRQLATLASTYCLQTLGFPAFAQGNLIYGLSRKPIGVEEACSGLGMLVIFLALSTAVAIVVRRPLLDRILILLSAVPIALAANIVRITVTGILYKTVGSELADKFFHGPAGWLMMPLALGFLWGELKVLSWVLVAPPEKEAVGLDFDENIRFPKRREGRRVEGEGPATRDEGQGVKDEGRAASDSSTPTPHPSPLAPHPSSLIPETRPEKDDTFPSPGLHA
jgi:exosortase